MIFSNIVLAAVPGVDCSQFVSTAAGDAVAFANIGNLLSVLINAVIIISGIFALVQLVLGGFQYISSGGDKVAAQNAREKITYAIMGLAIVVSVVAITQILGAVFGVNIFGNIKWPTADTIVGNYGYCH
ncbi:MAG: hypothetical protein M1352_01420 [Patescibacteria group bacterium]|nr:hypothetical protein [Patescibacteria group bacterium]